MQTLLDTERRIHVSPSDTAFVVKSLQDENFSLRAEQFDQDHYLDQVIPKPWGYEYRIFADPFYDLWKLSILPGQMTSMHCHPRKETALLCLGGRGKMQFLEQIIHIKPLDYIHIGKGVFHSTENTSDIPLDLVEVEVPRNKLDLVRLMDRYGRSGKGYETQCLDDYSMYTLHHGQFSPRSKMRRACLHNTYRFEVRAGMDFLCRPINNILFVVLLSVNNAIEHQIQVFPASFDQQDLELSELYFVISRNQ